MTNFSLNTSGVAGVFGGEEAVATMATVHVYEHRKWLGWYNSPGSYTVAKRYGLLANSRFFSARWMEGPKFRAAHSGSVLDETGHLASLFLKECSDLPADAVPGRQTKQIGVTVAELHHVPEEHMYPEPLDMASPIVALIPITVSIGTSVTCAYFHDWFSFSMILLGTIASGVSCLVIGSDGVLGTDKEIAVLRGPEGAVNCITRGKFSLLFSSEPHYDNIGWCSVLLMIQFVGQLLLIPQGSLFGQSLFLASLAVSWAYNLWLSALDKEKIQRAMLMTRVLRRPKMKRYLLGTRTSMAVFVTLLLKPEEPRLILDHLISNDTPLWNSFKETISQRLCTMEKEKLHFDPPDQHRPSTVSDEKLWRTLYGDAQSAYKAYLEYCRAQ
ncbi:hypothetical protein BKA82DRAFT_4111833 [Pisolithus tinctorius]|nr:hypothetical protein BKA82DRAFT_4111833 [Pisolithus tinctorius]